MPNKQKLKDILQEILKGIKDHSDKKDDHELKELCKKAEGQVQALDDEGGGGGNSPEPPDIP